MCFSSTASFTAAAGLVPLGLAACHLCRVRRQPQRLPLALTPLLFGVQQGLEGLVWQGLNAEGAGTGSGAGAAYGGPALLTAAMLGYLFFALAFWLAWLPWCALRAGEGLLRGWRRTLVLGCLAAGLLLGLLLWLPLLWEPARCSPAVVRGSIDYHCLLLGAGRIGHGLGSVLYGLTVGLPLLLSPLVRLRWFGVLILVAFAITQVFYLYAFSSVWCYFSALLSMQVLWVVAEERKPTVEAG
ncbi:MAG: DUF6629 family protein [Synechococcaceae cyanobacterium]|nr:DUF6629 family protein [Synechococcaceae cyanobacterium]